MKQILEKLREIAPGVPGVFMEPFRLLVRGLTNLDRRLTALEAEVYHPETHDPSEMVEPKETPPDDRRREGISHSTDAGPEREDESTPLRVSEDNYIDPNRPAPPVDGEEPAG